MLFTEGVVSSIQTIFQKTFGKNFQIQIFQNQFILRKLFCKRGTSNKLTIGNCSLEHNGHIGSNLIAVNINVMLNEPLDDLHVHTVFYYKYTVFRKFPIDLWENLCEILNPKKGEFYLASSFSKIIYDAIQHNGPLKCPLMGSYAVKLANVSTDIFYLPSLIPAGQYRIDTNVTEKNRNNVLLMSSLFVSVSDNRIEQF